MIATCAERVYANEGNWPLLRHLPKGAIDVLDVGCGAGDNAALLRASGKNLRVYGITLSKEERDKAIKFMIDCMVADIEASIPEALQGKCFDVIVFSHVLEHLRNPAAVVAKFSGLLKPAGLVLIAVPNILSWKQRWKFFIGKFEYTATGIMDSTHLRFFTYHTADRYLLAQTPDLTVAGKEVTGSVPLWILRRYLFPRRFSEFCDRAGCYLAPNLFGSQVIIVAEKKDPPETSTS